MRRSLMTDCLWCEKSIQIKTNGRPPKFCSNPCRMAYNYKFRLIAFEGGFNENPLKGQLVLECFPGAGLFGKAFEALGATVVRSPDILWGGDIHEFRGIRGRFDGIIGGPPCQSFSKAAVLGTKAQNLIPQFLRVVRECAPAWAVMENVREAKEYTDTHSAFAEWDYVSLKDWDCGGKTYRSRGMWFWGLPAPVRPDKREGEPAYSVLASSWQTKSPKFRRSLQSSLDECSAAELQGFPELGKRIYEAQPGTLIHDGTYRGVSAYSRRVLAVHMLGNGVPFALGSYVATHVAKQLVKAKSA